VGCKETRPKESPQFDQFNLGGSELILAIALLDRAGGGDLRGFLAHVMVEGFAHVVVNHVVMDWFSLPFKGNAA
jgi:hypothetical protein